MSEDTLFFRQAAEAIVATSLNSANVDPTIRELLSRIKYSIPTLPQAQAQAGSNGISGDTGAAEATSLSIDTGLLGFFASPMNLSLPNADGAEKFDSEQPARANKSKSSVDVGQEPRPAGDKSSEDKKYSCAKCKLEFRRTSDLRRHERTHLPVLPNICPQCGKGFARKDALKRHSNTLTCRRNRSKLLSIGGDINDILERARQTGNGT